MKKAILVTILSILFIMSCNNSSNAQTSINTKNNNTLQNQNNSSNAMYNQELKKAPINIQTNANGRVKSRGFAAVSANMDFKYHEFTRHAVGENDVLIEILYAGICHSDIHVVEGKSSNTPLVVGHEIAGRVVQVGSKVTKFKVGDFAGVGCMVNSCGQCESCLDNLEQYCLNRAVYTYGSIDRFHGNEITQGGYSDNIVVSENFAILIPDNAELDKVAPLLCAGITTYSPIKAMNVKKGDKIGIAGFGGLGYMAVKYAVKLGAEVTVFDITEDKRDDALNMGAVKYVNVNNAEDLKNVNNTLNYIISTIPAYYDVSMYMRMLKRGGTMCLLGLPRTSKMPTLTAMIGQHGSKKLFGSLIGGIKETHEMLNYSIENNIYPTVEIIKADAQTIKEAYRKVIDGEVKFRYVIDMRTINK
ncbi:hydroxyacid dehydrogenase [Brachyspira hampsonii]|uniref:Hydroxyacid dehydrogenase n=1 Tax=Brachyspira hampsonii TaxID=1287055 RepID=A0A1E5NE03_9SPIR|nr:NAD(P)-dependent alcohol dehydrogenase [Brachyspira hampsonii]OEJ14390.1 hydroxyacid dehydrogenase [Brachyspira hampsonii]